MAEVTYYFNARGDVVWSDPDNIVDNNLVTFGYTNVDASTQLLNGNTCPGDDLGTITKVELRLYAYGDGDDRIDTIPVFAAGDGTTYGITPGVGAGWTGYANITSSTNAPTPWTWADVVALDCKLKFTKVGKGNTVYCAKVEIRVTYYYWEPPVSDIDVGEEPVDRGTRRQSLFTYVSRGNPANASGTLHSVKVWAYENMTGFRVGTFYTTNGNTLKCRDSVVIGAVEAGAERTFTELSITVVAGDYIGCYFDSGWIERDVAGYSGFWYVGGEYIDPGDEATYPLLAESAISLYGYGDIVGVPENTVYLVKATGKRTQLSAGAEPIRIDPTTGRRSLDTSLTKFLVREDDGTLRAKSA